MAPESRFRDACSEESARRGLGMTQSVYLMHHQEFQIEKWSGAEKPRLWGYRGATGWWTSLSIPSGSPASPGSCGFR